MSDVPRGRIWDAIVLKSEWLDAKATPLPIKRERELLNLPSFSIFEPHSGLPRRLTPFAMVVRLRFSLAGPRHGRIFHMVAIDGNARRDARPLETLAIYNPRLQPGETHKTVKWSAERIKYWLRVGAEPSDSVVKLLTMVRLTISHDASRTPTFPCRVAYYHRAQNIIRLPMP